MRYSIVAALVVMGASTTVTAGSIRERRAPMLVPKTDNEALRAQIYATFPRAAGRWGAVHVIDRACGVSRDVVAHLIERRAIAELDEMVIVIGDGALERDDVELVHAGYRVRVTTRENNAAALAGSMIIARPDGTLAYVGGHRGVRMNEVATLGASKEFVDAAVATELVTTGATSTWTPVIGCLDARYTARTMQ